MNWLQLVTPYLDTSSLPALAGTGSFLLARVLGALIPAGLLAGFFPRFAETLTDDVVRIRPRAVILMLLLGFAVIATTPILVALLILTVVGLGLAFLIFFLYLAVMLLAFFYAGILLGSLLARRYARRSTVLWRDGVVGMLLLSLVALVPFAGSAVVLLAVMFSTGLLLSRAFHLAFPREEARLPADRQA